MKRRGYSLTDDIALLVHLLSKRVERLSHLRPGQILHGISQARTRSKYGVYAQCHGLRFRHGAATQPARNGNVWVWPDIKVRGQSMLYYITYFLPRFLDQPPEDRLHTLLHELYHISPRFDGDLRRFAGRNEYHGNNYDRIIDGLVEEARPHVDAGQFEFLQANFDQLTARHGAVMGNKLLRFKPRLLNAAAVPATPVNLAAPVKPKPAPVQPLPARPQPAPGQPLPTRQHSLF